MTKDWAGNKDRIIDLYSRQEKTLQDVRRIMEERYNFRASIRAYRGQLEKWNIRKYILRKNQTAQGGSPSASEGSPPDGLAFPTNGTLHLPDDQRREPSMLEDTQIPYMSLTSPYRPGHPQQQQQQQRSHAPHLPMVANPRRQQEQQGYQRRSSHGMGHLSQPRRSPHDLTFPYPEATHSMARTRSYQSRQTPQSHRMSTGYLQYPGITQDHNAAHQLQYLRSFQLPNQNTQLPSPAPSPSYPSPFQGNNLSPFAMVPSRPRPRTNSTPESLTQQMALPRNLDYYHSNPDARSMHHQRSLCDGPDNNYMLSSSSGRFSFPPYGLGDEWVASEDDGVISSYPPPPTSRRDHR